MSRQIYLLFFLLLPIIFSSLNPSDYDNEIYWVKNAKLNWTDFKGKVDRMDHSDALTSSSISFKYQYNKEEYIIEIYASFIPNDSYVRKGKETKYLLNHEQKHFDITEVFARKLRKEVKKYEGRGDLLDRRYNEIYDDIFKGLSEMQHKYDEETSHSMEKDKQQIWDRKVDKLLNEYKRFQSIKFTIDA